MQRTFSVIESGMRAGLHVGAQLYVAHNGSRPTTSDAVVAPTSIAPAPAEPVGPVGSTEPPVKPAPRPRTPKAPPAP